MRARDLPRGGVSLPRHAIALAFLIAATAALVPNAVGASLSPTIDRFDNAARGYLGCVETVDGLDIYCLVVAESADSSSTTVRVFMVPDRAPWFVSTDEAETLSASVVTVTGTGAQSALSIEAALPQLGPIRLKIFTRGAIIDTSQNDTCPIYPLHYEARSETRQINPVWRVTGEISNRPVVEYGPTCTDAFTGPTSATWRVVGAG